MGQTATTLREVWRNRYRQLLDMIFEEFSSSEIMLRPDEAMEEMEWLLERLANDGQESRPLEGPSESGSILRFNFAAYCREAHHYAVDRFYKTYFPRKRGGEPLPISYLDRLQTLRRKGMNTAQIATLMKQRQNTTAKQLTVAEKRWPEAWREAVERMKQRFPQFIAQPPKVDVGAQQTPRQQSKRRKMRARAGK